jgi:hypothetical protein
MPQGGTSKNANDAEEGAPPEGRDPLYTQETTKMAWRQIELLASAARTATPTVDMQYTPNIKRLLVFIDVTAVTATPSVTPAIVVDKPLPSATAADTAAVLTGAAITATGNTILQVGPGLYNVTNLVAGAIVPAKWSVTLTHGDSDSITYSVSAWVEE